MADGKMNGNGVNKNAMVAILNPNAAFFDFLFTSCPALR
jgi:hypothetical protein